MFEKNIEAHLRKDKRLAPLLDREWVRPSKPSMGVFHDLIAAVMAQQISTAAARTIRDRLTSRFQDNLMTPEGILEFDDDELRAVGLSRQKIGYVRNIAQHFIDTGVTDEKLAELTDEEIIKDLTRIKGVGKWTVEMILMHTFKRPDVFPDNDLGVQNAMIEVYGLDMKGKALKNKMNAIAESWRPYRSYGSWALWNSRH